MTFSSSSGQFFNAPITLKETVNRGTVTAVFQEFFEF